MESLAPTVASSQRLCVDVARVVGPWRDFFKSIIFRAGQRLCLGIASAPFPFNSHRRLVTTLRGRAALRPAPRYPLTAYRPRPPSFSLSYRVERTRSVLFHPLTVKH
jgi:hypothetical protein